MRALRVFAVVGIASVILLFQNCSRVKFDELPSVEISSVDPEPEPEVPVIIPQHKSCTLASGATIAHGVITVRFKKDSEGICQTLQPSLCVDGILSGDNTHNDASCIMKRESALSQNPALSTKCTLGNQSLYAGSFVIAFKKKDPSAGEGCVAEVRRCDLAGTLAGSFTEPYCQIKPRASEKTVTWDSVSMPDGAIALGFPEKVKTANGAFSLNYVFSDNGGTRVGRSNSAAVSLPEARWSRERTVWDVTDRPYLVLGHNDENKNIYNVSFNGKTTVTQCRVQIESALNNWVDLTAAPFACDALFAVKVLKMDSNVRWWTAYNKVNGARLRIVDNSNNAEIAISEGSFRCTARAGSSISTPDIDEDCDGNWDNLIGGHYY